MGRASNISNSKASSSQAIEGQELADIEERERVLGDQMQEIQLRIKELQKEKP